MYGAATHRLQEYMSMSSRSLEIEGLFFVLHPRLHDDQFRPQHDPSRIARESLGKMQDVHDIHMDFTHDRLGVEVITRRLDVLLYRRIGKSISRSSNEKGAEQLTSLREAVDQDQEPDLVLGPRAGYPVKPPCCFLYTKPVVSNIHVDVVNLLQPPEIDPFRHANQLHHPVGEADRHAVRDVEKLTFDLEG
ncbi:hypothetical protein E4U59_004232 [Claviceps monticola]|nr:hypothetical protein E4U59_004232 [Claviceps monticola]